MDVEGQQQQALIRLTQMVEARRATRTAGGALVLAMVAAHPRAGTSYCAELLERSLTKHHRNGVHRAELKKGLTAPTRVDSLASSEKSHDGNPEQLLASKPTSIEEQVSDLRTLYEFVLIECVSLAVGNDIRQIAPLVDGILVVVEADKTTMRQLAALEDAVGRSGGAIIGSILNQRTYAIPQWLFTMLEQWGF